MTPTEVKRALRRNRKVGRRPWSMYQIAQMRPCSRPLVTQVLQGSKRSRPLMEWIESVLGNGSPTNT